MASTLTAISLIFVPFSDFSPSVHIISTAIASHQNPDGSTTAFPAQDDWSRQAFVSAARWLAPGHPAEIRIAAAAWLADRLAEPALAHQPDAAWQIWTDWVLLPEPLFFQRLAVTHAHRAAELASERDSMARRLGEQRETLVGVYRRLYARLPAEERSPLLVEMITSGVPAVQGVACQLAMRTLQNAGALDREVSHAARRLLNAPDPALRTTAAQLIEQLDPSWLANWGEDQLLSESEPGVAATFLRAIAAHPMTVKDMLPTALEERNSRVAWAAVRWLDLGSYDPSQAETRLAAFDAAVVVLSSMIGTGRPVEPDWLDPNSPPMIEAADRLTSALPVRVTPESVQLLARLGRFRTVVELLRAPAPGVARAAAEGLSAQAQFVDPIVRAAQHRGELFEPALDALAAHRPNAEAFIVATSLIAPDPGLRRERLVAMASRLTPEQLLLAMRSTDEHALVVACLQPLIMVSQSAEGRNGTMDSRPSGLDRPVISPPIEVGLAARLARARLELGDALGTLDVVGVIGNRHADLLLPAAKNDDAEELALYALQSAVRLNRLDHAAALLIKRPSLADAWIAALLEITDPSLRAAATARLFEIADQQESVDLSPEQRARAQPDEKQHPVPPPPAQ